MSRPVTVSIVGAGQIGTLLGMALMANPRQRVATVGLYDRDPEVARRALARGAGQRELPDPDTCLESDIVLLAVPVDQIVAWLESYGPALRPGTLVLDTGSSKQRVAQAMRAHLSPAVHGIGGHPIVGTEGAGPEAAVPGKLEGAAFALTPARQDRVAQQRATELAGWLGCRVVLLEPEEHDRILARTSHLPHLVAAALVEVAARLDGEPVPALVGPGWLGATRLAASDPAMVTGFLATNSGQLALALRELVRELERLGRALQAGPGPLEAALTRARCARAELEPG